MGGSPSRYRKLYISLRHHASSSHCRRCVLSSNYEGNHSFSVQIQLLSFKHTSRMPPQPLTRIHSTPFSRSSGNFIKPSLLSYRRSAHHIRLLPLKSPLCVHLYGLCTSPRSSTIGKQQTTEERITKSRWEHPEGSRVCGEERLQQPRKYYIHGPRLQRSGQGRTNRLSLSVWTTLPPVG